MKSFVIKFLFILIAVVLWGTAPEIVHAQNFANFGIVKNASCDFNNDGFTDPAVFRPSTHEWLIYGQSTVPLWGDPGDIPVSADYNGDGRTDIAVFRPSNGWWYGDWAAGSPGFTNGAYGQDGDIPVPADYDGNGTTDIAIFRPSIGAWSISTTGVFYYGQSGDIPVPGDYNGDGFAEIAIYRPSTGYWYLSSGDPAGIKWGWPGDIPVPDDYDGNGTTDIAVYRPSDGTWWVYGVTTYKWGGGADDIPVPGHYNNAFAIAPTVWRSSTGTWWIPGGSNITLGATNDIPCHPPGNTGAYLYDLTANVFIDTNRDGVKDAGESYYTGGAAIGLSGAYTQSKTTDATGGTIFTTLNPGNYTLTLTVPTGYAASTTNGNVINKTLNPTNSTNTTASFGIVPLYAISGNVFLDTTKDGIKGSEANYTGGNSSISIQGTSGAPQTFTTADGVYTSGVSLPAGLYTVSYTSLPTSYNMTYPKNGPPPTYTVTIGSGCTTDVTHGSSCSSNNVINLNFGITNQHVWFECIGNSCRIDGEITNNGQTNSGFTDPIPDTASVACGGPNASITGSDTTTPGIIFSGGSDPDLGNGQASNPQNWQVGGSSYPEIFQGNVIRTSCAYLKATIRQSGITPINLNTVSGCSDLTNCTLPANLPNGVYQTDADSDVTLNTYTFSNDRNYVFIINGDLKINGVIKVPTGCTAIFSVTGDIIVDETVGQTNIESRTTDVEGLYSADGSFIIEGLEDCTNYPAVKDKRLNIAGSVVVNAAQSGGSFQYHRDLCAGNLTCPAFSIIARPDFLINAPEFIKFKADVWQEVAP